MRSENKRVAFKAVTACSVGGQFMVLGDSLFLLRTCPYADKPRLAAVHPPEATRAILEHPEHALVVDF